MTDGNSYEEMERLKWERGIKECESYWMETTISGSWCELPRGHGGKHINTRILEWSE